MAHVVLPQTLFKKSAKKRVTPAQQAPACMAAVAVFAAQAGPLVVETAVGRQNADATSAA